MSTTLAHEPRVEKTRYAKELLSAIDASGYHERRDSENRGVFLVVGAGAPSSGLSAALEAFKSLEACEPLDLPEPRQSMLAFYSEEYQEAFEQLRDLPLDELDVRKAKLFQVAHEIGHLSLAWGLNTELDSFILHVSRDSVRDLRRWVNAMKLKMPTISIAKRPQRRRKILRSPSQMRVTGLKEAA